MFKSLKKCTIVLVVLLLGFCSFGLGISTKGGLAFSVGPSMVFPISQYLKEYPGDSDLDMPPFRTAATYNVDFNPLGLEVFIYDNFSAGFVGGLSYRGTTKSLAYGSSLLKGYWNIGLNMKLFGQWKNIGTNLKYSIYYGRFAKTHDAFILNEVGVEPYIYFYNVKNISFAMTAPISFTWKNDTLSLNFGLGMTIDVGGFR
ncbi:MAG: hypothetical protein HUK24_06240 [Sphaerochaetaceae bacterium]|nr:hypothetical protein [Sphaerochaetaceae bacterium]